MPSSSCFECSPCKPCNGMAALFKRPPHAMPALRRAFRRMKLINRRRGRSRSRNFSSVRDVFWPLISMRSDGPPSSTDSGALAPSPSLDTPASRVLALQVQLDEAAAARKKQAGGGSDGCSEVEEACRSFEKHLMEMLVEERKVRDLMDVEELLCCWERLRCPVFVELVGRFYGELCMDLFSERETEGSDL